MEGKWKSKMRRGANLFLSYERCNDVAGKETSAGAGVRLT